MSATRAGRPRVARTAGVGERDLERRLTRFLANAAELLELAPQDGREARLDAGSEVIVPIALQILDELRALRSGGARAAALCELAVRGADLEMDLREQSVRRRRRTLAGVESALGRLRGITGPAEMLDSVCRELVRSCGFSRAMLSRVEGNTWVPWKTFFGYRDVRPSDEAWMASTRIPLDAMILERELLEHRRAAFVSDTSGDARALAPFVASVGTSSYVAAPVIPAGRVVGFLHADYYPLPRRVDEVDRDILWMFADGFGRLYERTVMLDRLKVQREQVRARLRNAEAIMDNLARAELELSRHKHERSTVSTATTLALADRRSAMDELLTPREREVLLLIVAGQSNRIIATSLVVSEGTVKAHVKQILRKLGAVNRSEAIARYVGAIESD
jgi:LuxR family transcriptional regulator, regulator of acetate metabolism